MAARKVSDGAGGYRMLDLAPEAEAQYANVDNALDSLRAYRDLAAPTNAQTVAVVKLLCRVCIGLIRLNFARNDSTD